MEDGRWLLLLHQIPPKPAYFRAKVSRRLAQVGALPVKNSAYLLPDSGDALEDLEWICQEITQQGGAAWLFRAETLAGMSSDQIEDSFRQLHAPEYEELIQQARELLQQEQPASGEALMLYRKLSRRGEELKRIDFFDCTLRGDLEELMSEIEKKFYTAGRGEARATVVPSGRLWVTRKGVKVDRIGSAWLIRRFIDPEAAFRFVDPDNYAHTEGEIRFDMFEGEFTHEGDLCTFEVLLSANNLRSNAALVAVAEIVHDIDLKDERYQRAETAGLARMVHGLCSQMPADELRIERGGLIFESLYQSFC
jgi:hypothetical protein